MKLREVVSIETPDAKQKFANNVRNKEMFLQKIINPGRKLQEAQTVYCIVRKSDNTVLQKFDYFKDAEKELRAAPGYDTSTHKVVSMLDPQQRKAEQDPSLAGHPTESEEFDPTDNPTDEYMAQQQKAADDMMSMKQMNKPFDYADKYASNTEAHKKPYHFIDPATGKTSGEGPYFGIVFSKLPQNDREWMALGFTKAINGAWFINNQYLKKLVDQNIIG